MTKSIDIDVVLKGTEPLVHQHAPEIQPYAHIIRMPIALSENTCKESVTNLNQLLADTMTFRDLYKKHHWQVAGPTFYQLHLLFDKHYEEQNEAGRRDRRTHSAPWRRERGDDAGRRRDDADSEAAEGPRGSAVQISRLLHAHEIVLEESRTMARLAAEGGDDGSNDLIVSDVIRRNELQVWFLAEHVVNIPLTHAK